MKTTTYNLALQEVAKSILCHPEWDLATHIGFMQNECGFNMEEPITTSRYPTGPRTHPLRDYIKSWVTYPQRCVEHAANVAKRAS